MVRQFAIVICLSVAFLTVMCILHLKITNIKDTAMNFERYTLELKLCTQEVVEYKDIRLVRYGASADVDALPCDYVWLIRVKEVQDEVQDEE